MPGIGISGNLLTMSMAVRRFTKLTNAFSKKLDNHAHMVALGTNSSAFIRRYGRHRRCPRGSKPRLWSMEDVGWLNGARIFGRAQC